MVAVLLQNIKRFNTVKEEDKEKVWLNQHNEETDYDIFRFNYTV